MNTPSGPTEPDEPNNRNEPTEPTEPTDTEVVAAVVEEQHDGMRADRYVSEVLELFPRSRLKTRDAHIRVGGRPVKPSRSVHSGDYIEVEFRLPELVQLEPENIPLSVLFENDHVLVVNKPQGMVVHPAQGNYTGTLAQGVLYYLYGASGSFEHDNVRPGIVHRLDKDTSGVIIVAKTTEAYEALSAQFKGRHVEKTYVAITKGVPRPRRGRVEGFIRRDPHNRKRFAHDESEGKAAVTEYSVLRAFSNAAVVVLTPHTGRTHQLRVHMRHLDCPIVGDPIYARHSSTYPDATLMLHALSLRLTLPGERAPRTFTAAVPPRFSRTVSKLIGREPR